jgi:hypothetical protein
MAKKKETQKRPVDMTSDELARYLFGAEAAAELKRIAVGDEKSEGGSNSAHPKDSESP